ncbi:MAG: phosphoglucomutase (alpha-D-glucose-1,6-bisphosphate-dependent) [Propionibacteriaceae bacterium]|jgi:phosphoglucomutase|nr:phosphoglucomutase (alpha-D-glucose-1,6-bisphosphate-dependent) [Propionibacteriaceae bacterium]
MTHPRAGLVALPEDLIDTDGLISAYYDLTPNPEDPDQKVAFGTSGHRGSSFDVAFNEAHIACITQALIEYRASQGTTGPLFIAKDTHGLSIPAWKTALEVLAANSVTVLSDKEDEYTPTPALSRAIIAYNEGRTTDLADGIVVTPSHNPPRDGGFKYNPPNGGPADTDATGWIANRANELLRNPGQVTKATTLDSVSWFDFRTPYCESLSSVVDIDAIREAGVRIGANPLGGASLQYWQYIAENLGLNLTVTDTRLNPDWNFMTVDHDGKIRMDCSSPYCMANVVADRDSYDISTGNDADADRHGIVTPDGGLMNPNHYLAVAIEYLFTHRPGWASSAGVGKTLVSSSIIDRVAFSIGRTLVEVPVGFKWFVPGLIQGTLGFGGEESAGASFLTREGKTWTTDKDGIILCLLASEILAITGKTPSALYVDMESRFGASSYARTDAPANREQKARLSNLSPDDVTATELAGEPITAALTAAPGNGAAIGGLKVTTENAWFAARPSGTENIYKIYAESFLGADHLAQVQEEARAVVDQALG